MLKFCNDVLEYLQYKYRNYNFRIDIEDCINSAAKVTLTVQYNSCLTLTVTSDRMSSIYLQWLDRFIFTGWKHWTKDLDELIEGK